MTVTVKGETVQCDRAVKGADWLRLYLDGEEVMRCTGVADFGAYALEGGAWEIPPADLEGQLAALALSQARQDSELAGLRQANAALMLQLARTVGGAGNV